ncbi:MAG: hypothetical protein FWD36_06460 [Treponema sp.]|nr:hypothetical protein [Treponema sp.]
MAIIENVQTWHCIRGKPDAEKACADQNVCAAREEHGGFAGNYGTFVDNINQFFDGKAHQVYNGFAANTGYF